MNNVSPHIVEKFTTPCGKGCGPYVVILLDWTPSRYGCSKEWTLQKHVPQEDWTIICSYCKHRYSKLNINSKMGGRI